MYTPPKLKKRIDPDELAELGHLRARLPDTVDDDAVVKPTAEGRARAEAALAADKRKGDMFRPTPGKTAPVAPVGDALPREDKGKPAGVSELGSMAARLEAERKAAADELKEGKAKALADASARAGLAGMGLSGGTAALASDIGRSQDRSAVLALAEIDRRHRDEEFTDVQRQAAIFDLEEASDRDVDGDGMVNGRAVDPKTGIGDGNVDNDEAAAPKTPTETKAKQAADLKKKLERELVGEDLLMGDPDTESGSKEEPYLFSGNIVDLKGYLRGTGAWPLETIEYGGLTLFKDQHGNFYILDRNDDGRGSNG